MGPFPECQWMAHVVWGELLIQTPPISAGGSVLPAPSLRLATLFHYLKMQYVNGKGIVYFVNFLILCILAQLGKKVLFEFF